MKSSIWIGIALIVLGALALAYQGFNYSRTERMLEMGPMHVTQETQKRIPVPPILGGLALLGGVVLLVVGVRRGVQ